MYNSNKYLSRNGCYVFCWNRPSKFDPAFSRKELALGQKALMVEGQVLMEIVYQRLEYGDTQPDRLLVRWYETESLMPQVV